MAETVDLTGIGRSSVRRYRKHLQAALTQGHGYPQRAQSNFIPRCYKKAELARQL